MKQYIIAVNDKNNLKEIKKICNVIFVSRYMNIIGVKIKKGKDIYDLKYYPNVISLRECQEGRLKDVV